MRKGTGTNFPLRSRRAVPRATRKPAAWNTDPPNSLEYERGVSLWFGVKFRRVLAVFCLVPVPVPLQPLPSAAAGAPNGRQPPGPCRPVPPALPLPPARSRPQRQRQARRCRRGQSPSRDHGAATLNVGPPAPPRCNPARHRLRWRASRLPASPPGGAHGKSGALAQPVRWFRLYGARTAHPRGTAPRGHTTRPAGAASATQDGDRRGRYRDRFAPHANLRSLRAGWGLCPCCLDGWRGGGKGRP